MSESLSLRRTQKLTFGMIASALAVFWVVTAVMGRLSPQLAAYALVYSTAMWVGAALLLLRRWWPTLSTLDTPGRVLAFAVAALPEHRREWGTAMLAELDEVPGRTARWRFALSGVRATLMLPPASGWPVLALAGGVVVTAVIAAGPVVGGLMPELAVFAPGFVGVFGSLAIVTLGHATRPKVSTLLPGSVVTAGVAGAIAMTVVFLRRDPSAAVHLPPVAALLLGAVLAVCLWVAFTASPKPVRANRFVPHLGAGAALTYAVVFLLLTQFTYNPHIPQAPRELVGMAAVLWMLLAPHLTLFTVALGGGLIGGSLRSGLRAGVWSAVAGVPLMYGLWLLLSRQHMYPAKGGLLFFGDGAPEAENLGFAVSFCVLAVVVFGPPTAMFGAALGARLGRATPKSD